MLKTDLSSRERKRYAQSLRNIAANAQKLADALEAENDLDAVLAFMMLSLEGQIVNELGTVFIDAAKADLKPTSDEFDTIARRINEGDG